MLFTTRTADEMIDRLRRIEAEISDLRCEQAVLVNELNKLNIAARDGHRSINEWLSAELDVSRVSAGELAFAGRHLPEHRPINFRLADGHITFDRAVALMRLADADADPATMEHAETLDMTALTRITAQQRRITRYDEHRIATERYVSIQPTLDQSAWHLTGLVGPIDGQIIEAALTQRADQIRTLPNGDQATRGQRQADALVAIAQDALNSDGQPTEGSGGRVTVLIDLGQANGTGGERGAQLQYGPRIGPAALEELLCTGTVQLVGLTEGKPVATTDATRIIPPAIRSHIAHRDGGCTIAGCTSRYRLEPHHITPRSQGGTHEPDNLTTLCWYHHHIAIHQNGMHLDPNSPPQQRRLIRPNSHAPPGIDEGPV